MPLFDTVGLVGSPVQWAVVLLVVLVFVAPRLLPPIGRILGWLIGMEIRRRLGLPMTPPPVRRAVRTDEPGVEVLPPERPVHTVRAGDIRPLAVDVPSGPVRSRAIWPAAVVVCAAVAVLLWYLLHAR